MPVTLKDVIRTYPNLPGPKARHVKPGLFAITYDGSDTGHTVVKRTWGTNDPKVPAWYRPSTPWELRDENDTRVSSHPSAKDAAASLAYKLHCRHYARLYAEMRRDEETAYQAAAQLADLNARLDSPALDQAATDLGTDPATLLNTLRRHGLIPKEN